MKKLFFFTPVLCVLSTYAGILVNVDLLPKNAKPKPVPVEQFGAKGDGKTDDYRALKAAFLSKKPIVLAAHKVYLTSGTLDVTTNGKIITGYGAELRKTTITVNTIHFIETDNFQLLGLKMTLGKKPYQSGLESHAVTVTRCNHFVVQDCVVEGSCEMGFNNQSCSYGTYYRNTIRNTFRDAIYAHYSFYMVYNGNKAYNIKDDAFSMHDYGQQSERRKIAAAGFTQAGHSKIINNYINGAVEGISSIGLDGLEISGNKIENVSLAGIGLFNSSNLSASTSLKNIVIRNNIINRAGTNQTFLGNTYTNNNQFGTGSAAIYTGPEGSDNTYNTALPESKLYDVSISKNTITNCGVSGIVCYNVVGLSLVNNKAVNCNIYDSNYTRQGIYQIINCERFVAKDNIAIDNNTLHKKHYYGYYINAGNGISQNWNIQGFIKRKGNVTGNAAINTNNR